MQTQANVHCPESADELARLLVTAAGQGVAVVTHPHLNRAASEARAGAHLMPIDLLRLNSVIEHHAPDQVIQVGCGISVRELNARLAGCGQMLPLSVPGNWTIADALLSGEAGDLEHGFGGMRDLVLGMSAVLADGTAIKCGGKVVKNVSGYDVGKLLIGSHGWLALPCAVNLRLYAAPEVSRTLVWSFETLWQAMNLAKTFIQSGLPFASLELMPASLAGATANRYALAVRLLSMSKVCDEVCGAAEALAGGAEINLTGEASEKLWQTLQEKLCAGSALKVVAAPSLVPEVLALLPQRCIWSARPSKGKIIAVIDQPQPFLDQLMSLSRKEKQPLMVGYGDEQYYYRVRQLPADDAGALEIKRRIKQALDPGGLFNPFVQP